MGGDELLRALGGIGAPGRAASERAPGGGSGASSTGAMDFRAMLERASAGAFDSGLPVSVVSGASVQLNESQLARLGQVIDRLHASGASHALVEIDGRFLVVDVLTRQVRSEFQPGAGQSVDGIDAVASAPPAPEGALGPPRAGVPTPSLASALIDREDAA